MDERARIEAELERLSQEFATLGIRLRLPQIVASDLTLQQVKVLALLVQADPPMVAAEVAETLGVTPATVSGIVARLVEAGLVEQVASAEDRRTRRLVVTADGRVAVDELANINDDHRRRAQAQMSEEELGCFLQGLAAFVRGLRGPDCAQPPLRES